MVGLEIRVLLEKEKRKEFLHAFGLLSKPHDQDDACVQKTLYENVSEDGCFIWMERWTNLKALQDHLKSEHFRSILGAIEVLGKLENLHLAEYRVPPDDFNIALT
jgi:quinol monooxygenase YgiN